MLVARRHEMGRAPAGCAAGSGGLMQAMHGRVSGCMQVGPLRGGAHTVVLEQLLDFRTGKPPLTLAAPASTHSQTALPA